MNQSTQLSLLLLVSLIFISDAISPVKWAAHLTSNTKLYEVICNDAGKDGNERCLKLIQGDQKITSAKDYPTLSKAVLHLAIEKSTSAQNEIKKLVGKYPSSNAIKECATSNYNGLINSFKSALVEVDEDPLTASYDAKVAGDDPVLCQAHLDSEHLVDPIINTLNNDMSFLSMVAFYATNRLENN